MKTIYLILVFTLFSTFLSSTIINVPVDQPSIQAGINAAVNADTVLVQPGTYFENIDYNGKNITISSLFLTTQDTTYISQTVIDGNQNDSVVIFQNEEDSTAVLSGFTITNGFGHYFQYTGYLGGGICVYAANPTLSNLIVKYNNNINLGGGIGLSGANCKLKNIFILGNTGGGGGGIFLRSANCKLTNVIILGNTAIEGGGLSSIYSSIILENVMIRENHAANHGGGIYDSPGRRSIVTLENTTITNNSAEDGGGIYCVYTSSPSLVNCILWNNSPEEISGAATVTYSNIQGGWVGEGNIDEDPLFVATGDHPYSLLEGSPCIDAGIPETTGLNLPPWDIIGNHRIWDGDEDGAAIIDMGAYEFGAPPYVDIDDNVIVHTLENLLLQNYPNPFNPTTTINYSLKQNSKVSLNIYNVKGQKVKQLVNDHLSAGQHSVVWNGKDDNNKTVSSGIYFYKMKIYKYERTRKMILMK